jgi:hypothetical protein
LPFGENTADENTELDRSTLLDRDIVVVTLSLATPFVSQLQDPDIAEMNRVFGMSLCSNPLFW